jgi:hypothetical protein
MVVDEVQTGVGASDPPTLSAEYRDGIAQAPLARSGHTRSAYHNECRSAADLTWRRWGLEDKPDFVTFSKKMCVPARARPGDELDTCTGKLPASITPSRPARMLPIVRNAAQYRSVAQ